MSTQDKLELLQGTLDLLILRTLILSPQHGHGIVRAIQQTSDEELLVEHGALYPALQRLEERGWISARSGVYSNNRRARFYSLTALGRKQLVKKTNRWKRLAVPIGRVVGPGETQTGASMKRQQTHTIHAGFLRLTLALVILCLSTHLIAQSRAPVTLVKAAHLLDPRSGNVLAPAEVLIEGDKIKQVGAHINAPKIAKIIDLGDATLLPGLIDSHTHLLLNIVIPPEEEIKRHENGIFAPGLLLVLAESPTKRAFLGAQMAREDLESGITTVRNLGHSGIDGDTELRDAINAGRVPGPRILAAGRKLITRGDYLQNLNPALADAILNQEFLFIDGADRARAAVRQNIFRNVDVIKVTADVNLTVPELAAVLEEAHRNHLKLAVHAIEKAAIQTAIDAGVDSIEHGNEATDEQLKQVHDKGIFFDLTPTFYGSFFLKVTEPNIVLSAETRSSRVGSGARRDKQYNDLLQRVLKAGVKVAAGSDMCWFYSGKTRGQASIATFVNLRAAGMPALDVIRAVTVNAAEMLGWQDRIGAVEPGKFADIIAVAGDPLADITELERVRFVMKGGEVIRNDCCSHASSSQ